MRFSWSRRATTSLVSLTYGVARMRKRYFVTYTALGSIIFCFGLAYLGDSAGHNVDALEAALHKIGLAVAAAVVGLAVLAFVLVRLRGRRRTEPTDSAV